jgi:glycosyltransferase involved in cell wall biosynthesis
MPVYNCEKYVAEAIESILTQTYKNIELICINDASTDKSRDVLKSFVF